MATEPDSAPPLEDLHPMLLSERRTPPAEDADVLCELKYDGYRVLAEVAGGPARLRTREGADCTKWFPEVVRGLEHYRGGRLVLDGEMAVLDELGRSDFPLLHARAMKRRYTPGAPLVTYCAFDILVHEGRSVMQRPLTERKALLRSVLSPDLPGVLYVSHVEGMPHQLFAAARQLQLEGIVYKDPSSVYTPGVISKDWVKWKIPAATRGFRRPARSNPLDDAGS